MRGSDNTDLFDPKTEMDSNFSRHGSSSEGDFGFAFNDSNFSDRLLRIEILGGPSDSRSDAEGCTSIADWARHRKRRREDNKKDNGGTFDSLSVGISDFVVVFMNCSYGWFRAFGFKCLRNLYVLHFQLRFQTLWHVLKNRF